jgi:lipid-A-disaccharide synthase
MIEQGLESIFPFYELSMLGAVEILPYLFNISARIRHTVEDVISKNPDVMVTIDSPGFCFRVVERLREEKNKLKCKFVHYVAPTVWVYKPERADLCARLFDHMLVLLPFEPPYFEKAGLACTWVGHPVIAETATGNGAAFRQKFEIPPDAPLFCMLPGSRKSEVERHMPIFGKAVSLLATQFPQLSMVVAVPPNIMPFITPFFAGCPFRAVVTSNDEDKKNAIAASQIALVKSGTVALEVAMANVPMIVTYKVHPLSAWYLRRKLLIKNANLINILMNEDVIPEMLQELCDPVMIATACAHLLTDLGRQENQKSKEKIALEKLLLPDGKMPSDVAAKTILSLVAPVFTNS